MKATQLEYGKLQSSIFKLGKELGEAGAEVLTRIDEDEAFRTKVAGYMLRGAPEEVVPTGGLPYNIAKAIMGENKVFGIDEIKKISGIVCVDEASLAGADRVPYLPETLAEYKDTHLLVYGTPTVIKDIAQWSETGFSWRMPQDEVEDPSFLTDLPARGWFLMNRSPQSALGLGERLATVVEAYFALSLHKAVNKRQFFFKHEYAVCNQTAQGGEIYFGLGCCFVQQYGPRSYNYWAVKDSSVKRVDDVVSVVLPDNPIN